MKQICITVLCFFFFSTALVANAVSLEEDIFVMEYAFSGKGEITSFDVNSEGNILICVNQAYSYNKYIMIFQSDKTLLYAYKIRFPHRLYAMFSEEKNIVIYAARSTEATVFNNRGEILYSYSENYLSEKREAEAPDRRRYGDIEYWRNENRNQIIKCENGEKEILYEMASSLPEFFAFWLLTMLFIIFSFMFWMLRREKWLKRQKENSAQ